MAVHTNVSATDLANALGELVTNYPTRTAGQGAVLTLAGPDGVEHPVPLDPGHVVWLTDLVQRARNEAERTDAIHPLHGVCSHCGEHKSDQGEDPTDQFAEESWADFLPTPAERGMFA